jgi:hypothetical protein
MSGGRGSLIRTMPDKGRRGSENPSFGRTSLVNGPLSIINLTCYVISLLRICIGYFEATRGYVIYSPRRAAPR